jgi:hypothetical protein
MADRSSQRPGVRLDEGAKIRAHAAGQYQVHFAVQFCVQRLGESQIIAEASIFGKVDQQIDIAVRPLLTAGNRTEHLKLGAP